MKKIYLLILTLAFAQGALFAQYNVGDYKTVTSPDKYFWTDPTSWEIYNGSSWDPAVNAPGTFGNKIEYNVFVERYLFIFNSTITVESTGKIFISDVGNDSFYTLFVGWTSDNTSSLNISGEVIIGNGDAFLDIQDGSYVNILSGGKITDNSVNGNINTNTSGNLVIKSIDGTETGSLITRTTGLTGKFNQYITAGQWHLISTPLNNTIADYLWNKVNAAYMKPYDFGWGDYITDINTPINVCQGYELWETVNFTFSSSGFFNTGNQIFTVTSGGAGLDTDWNVVGNPYPCGLDWRLVDEKYKVVASTFWVLNNGTYHYSNGIVSDGISPIIPPFQGFFVRYNPAWDGLIHINDEDKAHPDAGNVLYKSSDETVFTNLINLEADLNGQKSSAFFYQQNDATNGNDLAFDAPKLFSEDHIMDVYTFAGDNPSCINIYSEYPYVMEVGFKVPAGGGEITLTPTDLDNMDPLLSLSLQDKETGAYFDFLETPTYTFNAPGGDVTDRIYLIMNNNVGTKDIDKSGIQIFSNKNAIYLVYSDLQFSGELRIYNLLGQTVYQSKITSNNYKPIYLNQPSAYYIVELITENESINQKVFIQQ